MNVLDNAVCSARNAVRATIVALGCNVCRWSHEFRTYGISDDLAQDSFDLRFGRMIERPANHLIDRLQLIGMTRPPQRCRDALVEHPPDRQMNNALAEALRGIFACLRLHFDAFCRTSRKAVPLDDRPAMLR